MVFFRKWTGQNFFRTVFSRRPCIRQAMYEKNRNFYVYGKFQVFHETFERQWNFRRLRQLLKFVNVKILGKILKSDWLKFCTVPISAIPSCANLISFFNFKFSFINFYTNALFYRSILHSKCILHPEQMAPGGRKITL